MSAYRRYGLPFCIMIGSGLLVRLLNTYLIGDVRFTLVSITTALALFCFGMSLNVHKKRRTESWIKKLLISFVFLFFMLWSLGYILFPELKTFFSFLGIEGFVIYMVYAYCGWAFFD